MCGYFLEHRVNARQICTKSTPDEDHMRAVKSMKNNTSEPIEPPKVYDDLELSPFAADVLWELHFWKRRTMTDLARSHRFRHSSRPTIIRHLRKLMRDGLVRQHGKGRATWYTL
jgi:predicted HTH transcriptional regulator